MTTHLLISIASSSFAFLLGSEALLKSMTGGGALSSSFFTDSISISVFDVVSLLLTVTLALSSDTVSALTLLAIAGATDAAIMSSSSTAWLVGVELASVTVAVV